MKNEYIVDKSTIETSTEFKKHICLKYGILSIILILFFIILVLVLINISYKEAIKEYKKENYEKAYTYLSKYPNYKKSSKYLREITYNNLNNIKEGDIVFLGKHNNKAISWKVLKIKDNRYLLITNGTISLETTYSTWSDSDIRDLLNNNFYYSAFNEKEKEIIMTYYIEEEDSIDKVFLLNEEEAYEYNLSNDSKILYIDEYKSLEDEIKIKPVIWITKEKVELLNLYQNGNLEGLEEKDIYKTEIGMYDYLLEDGEDTIYYWKGLEKTYFAKVSDKDDQRVIVNENINIEAINDVLKKRAENEK